MLFCAFFLSFPRILGVPRREKTLAFLGKSPCFFQKSKGWRVRVISCQRAFSGPYLYLRRLRSPRWTLVRLGLGSLDGPNLLFLSFLVSLPFSFARNSLRFRAFFPSFPRILGVRQAEEILAFLVVFPAVFQKGKEKKIRGWPDSRESIRRFAQIA